MTDYKKRLEAAKRSSTLQLMFKCSRLLNERALASLPSQHPARAARPAHMALFPHIDIDEGTRLTDIAAQLGITKQGVGQLVDDLEEFGVVRRAADPEDGRAKRVVFTEAGKASILDGIGHLKGMEKSLKRELGGEAMKSLHQALLLLHDHLEG